MIMIYHKKKGLLNLLCNLFKYLIFGITTTGGGGGQMILLGHPLSFDSSTESKF